MLMTGEVFPSKLAWLLEDASSEARLMLKDKACGCMCVNCKVLLKLAPRVTHKYVYMIRKGIGKNPFMEVRFVYVDTR